MAAEPEDLDLAAYSQSHRSSRQRGMENGTVKKTGKRVKNWVGYYHVYLQLPGGGERRDMRRKILGPVSEMTKAEAEEKLRVFIRRTNLQPAAETAAATVATLCDDLLQLREGDWTDHTRVTNAGILKLIKAGLGARPLDSVKAEDLKLFLNSLPNRTWKTPKGKIKKGASESQVKKTITQLRALFDLALDRELITRNPSRSPGVKLKVPVRAKRPDKSIFPPQELPLLMTKLNRRDQIIIWISILGSTRPNELFALHGRDVGPGWLNIGKALDDKRRFKDTKTGECHYTYVPPFLMADLKAWMNERATGPDDLVFPNQVGRPMSNKNFLRRRLRPAAKRAGITTLDVDFQMLRRSFATIANALGLDLKAIQSQMGHAPGSGTTVREYMQPVDARRMEQLEQMEKILRGELPMPVDVMAKLGSQRIN